MFGQRDFYSRTSREVRQSFVDKLNSMDQFLLTHLSRGATGPLPVSPRMSAISTHAPLARCDPPKQFGQTGDRISTHAPLARCDVQSGTLYCRLVFISTHAPLARCDWTIHLFLHVTGKFLLTHLSRGATDLKNTGHLCT